MIAFVCRPRLSGLSAKRGCREAHTSKKTNGARQWLKNTSSFSSSFSFDGLHYQRRLLSFLSRSSSSSSLSGELLKIASTPGVQRDLFSASRERLSRQPCLYSQGRPIVDLRSYERSQLLFVSRCIHYETKQRNRELQKEEEERKRRPQDRKDEETEKIEKEDEEGEEEKKSDCCSLTHFSAETGSPRMVDVSEKRRSVRTAEAQARVWLSRRVYRHLLPGGGKRMKVDGRLESDKERDKKSSLRLISAKKGDVFKVAELAGILAAKKTGDLIPLCHNISLSSIEVSCTLQEDEDERDEGKEEKSCSSSFSSSCFSNSSSSPLDRREEDKNKDTRQLEHRGSDQDSLRGGGVHTPESFASNLTGASSPSKKSLSRNVIVEKEKEEDLRAAFSTEEEKDRVENKEEEKEKEEKERDRERHVSPPFLVDQEDGEPESSDDSPVCVVIRSRIKCIGQTGAEMEALTAVSIASLTLYDMCKAIDKKIKITDLRLLSKTGGKSSFSSSTDKRTTP